MSDRLPGTSQSNPIQYRGWNISITQNPYEHGGYDYWHDDYDPTPLYLDDPPADGRCGYAKTIEGAKAEIDEYEDEHAGVGMTIYTESATLTSRSAITSPISIARVTPVSQAIIDNYQFKSSVKTFKGTKPAGSLWFDIPFAYDPYWEGKRA